MEGGILLSNYGKRSVKVTLRVKEQIELKGEAEGRTISAYEIAKALGVSHNTIRAYLRNEVQQPSLQLLGKLCEYLDCDISDLMVLEEEESLLAV